MVDKRVPASLMDLWSIQTLGGVKDSHLLNTTETRDKQYGSNGPLGSEKLVFF